MKLGEGGHLSRRVWYVLPKSWRLPKVLAARDWDRNVRRKIHHRDTEAQRTAANHCCKSMLVEANFRFVRAPHSILSNRTGSTMKSNALMVWIARRIVGSDTG